MAWLTQIGWFYVADSLVWGILAVNLFMPWLTVRGLHIARHSPAATSNSSPFEDDLLTLSISVKNLSIYPKDSLTLHDDCPLAPPGESSHALHLPGLLPRSQSQSSYQVSCYRRGLYTLSSILVESSAPFGLFRSRRLYHAPLQLTVYPRVIPLQGQPRRSNNLGSRSSSLLPVTSDEFRGTRRYQSGDLVRNIHWRNSARQGRLMIKEFDEGSSTSVAFVLLPDLVSGDDRDTPLEYAIRAAASIAGWCRSQAVPFRMWPAPPVNPSTHWRDFLTFLASLDTPDLQSQPIPINITSSSDAIILAASAGGIPSLQSFAASQRSRHRPIALLFHGFDTDDDSTTLPSLRDSGIEIVPCAKGGLETSLQALLRLISNDAIPSSPALRP
jgi:uncharacterized protein (DUF58 family)